MSVRSLRLITIAGSVAIGISFNPVQPQSLDRRAYKGNLECERTPAAGKSRTSLGIIVYNNNRSVHALTDVYDIDGLRLIAAVVVGGTVDLAGVFHFGGTLWTHRELLRANYTLTLSATGGTLTGTQVWTRDTGGESVARTCTGIVFEVEPPKR